MDNVVVIGSGPLLQSLISSLLESGLSAFQVIVTSPGTTGLHKQNGIDWRQAVKPFHSILYASTDGDMEELRALHAVCKQDKKALLPVIWFQNVGMAGPYVGPEAEGCWESAWRRIHRTALGNNSRSPVAFTPSVGALLANVIVFDLIKTRSSGKAPSELINHVYVMDLETLEGDMHEFMPHPLVTGRMETKWVQDLDRRLEEDKLQGKCDELLPFFGRLSSKVSGVFHTWGEEELNQLPLSQCRIQIADPLSEGPADLLPSVVCTGLTHHEARRKAGLVGIEGYASRMRDSLLNQIPHDPQEFLGIGAGATFAEAVYRGLRKCLADELSERVCSQPPSIQQVHIHTVEDKRCSYFLQALITMRGIPTIGLGGEASGFPVVWVYSGGTWYGSVDVNLTCALCRALQQALQQAQIPHLDSQTQGVKVTSVAMEEEASPLSLTIPSVENATPLELLCTALPTLKSNGKRLCVIDIELEPFLKETPVRIAGTFLREENSR